MPEKLFARQVDIGVGRMDISTEDLVIDAPVVVQEVTAVDGSGQERVPLDYWVLRPDLDVQAAS